MYTLILKDKDGKVFSTNGDDIKKVLHNMFEFVISKYQIRG